MSHYLLYLSEQFDNKPLGPVPDDVRSLLVHSPYSKSFEHKKEMLCFCVHNHDGGLTADTSYFVGADWLVEGKVALYVEPKLNETEQIDFLGMLWHSLAAPENLDHLEGLVHADYESPWISIPEKHDRLSPILIVQFLKILQRIVRKGLKKSYYRVTENLHNRVRGKVCVGQQIKKNILKNKLTSTICSFQEFGVNTRENQFLKLVLEFVSAYLNQPSSFFSGAQQRELHHILNFCLPAFEQVDVLRHKHERIQVSTNVFYREYSEAMKIGEYILKRFSFNIDKVGTNKALTPPFWIDMSKLFELYVFGKLTKLFPEIGAVSYHDNFRGGKQTDILIHDGEYRCVIDCKYKPRYEDEDPSLEDKRQLAGYTRLRSVYNRLGIPQNEVVKGLIIYSHQSRNENILHDALFSRCIEEYVQFYKLGIGLPSLGGK